MNSLILRTMAPLLTGLMLVFSIFILLRGHNAPGGGFIGGLIAAAAFALHALAFGVEATRRALRLPPLSIAAIGLLLAALAGMVSAAFGVPYMTGIWFHIGPADGGLDVATVQAFDIGVYLVVLGAFASILLALEETEDE